jgi:hypothetical protein
VQHAKLKTALWCSMCLFALGVLPASAQSPVPASTGVTIELNKFEPQEKSCRAYFVIDNPGDKAFQVLKLDLVLFQPDGVINRRVAIDLAPLKAAKRTVQQYDFEGLACDKVGNVLVNDVVECKAEAGAVADCLGSMTFKSLAGTIKFGTK